MKSIFYIAFALLATQQARAQYTERVQLNMGNFVVLQKDMLNRFSSPNISQAGIAYQHKFNQRIGIRLAYSEWLSVSEYYAPSGRAAARFAENESYKEPNYYSVCTALDLVASYRMSLTTQ